MNRFFPDVPPARRRGLTDGQRDRLRLALARRDAHASLRARAERNVDNVTTSVTSVVAFLLGVTLSTLVWGGPSLGVLWTAAGLFGVIQLARLPFIRRGYLRDLEKLQEPGLIGDARPRSHSDTDNGE